MNPQEQKKALRKQILEHWKKLSAQEREGMHRAAYQRLISDEDFPKAKHILIYSAQGERELSFFRQLLENFPERRFYFPRVEGEELRFFPVGSFSELKRGAFGILEPSQAFPAKMEEVDLIVVPAMAADRNLNRMGRGGGYYDRFLAEHPKPRRLCVLPFFSVFNEIPAESFDQKIHRILEIDSP